MALYNKLFVSMTCPRCGETVDVEVNAYFGYRQLIEYRVGDTCEWHPRRSPDHGGRPEGGNMDGEGYTECLRCRRDFFVRVLVRDDEIVGAIPDLEKQPFISD